MSFLADPAAVVEGSSSSRGQDCAVAGTSTGKRESQLISHPCIGVMLTSHEVGTVLMLERKGDIIPWACVPHATFATVFFTYGSMTQTP